MPNSPLSSRSATTENWRFSDHSRRKPAPMFATIRDVRDADVARNLLLQRQPRLRRVRDPLHQRIDLDIGDAE